MRLAPLLLALLVSLPATAAEPTRIPAPSSSGDPAPEAWRALPSPWGALSVRTNSSDDSPPTASISRRRSIFSATSG